MRIFHGWCRSKARLDGKTAVVTGCNIGIGKETVLDFVKRGGRVVMACRDMRKAEEAADDIRKQTNGLQGVGEMVLVKLDLSSLKSVEECAMRILQTEDRINILVNNAGNKKISIPKLIILVKNVYNTIPVYSCTFIIYILYFIDILRNRCHYCRKMQKIGVIKGNPKALTEDGFEWHFEVNHLGHFLFTCLLLPRILRSVPARIINLSSIAHWGAFINFNDINMESIFHPFMAYGRSKLCNLLFSKELGKRLEGTGVTTYAVHPGIIETELWRNEECLSSTVYWIWKNIVRLSKTSECGAQTTIYCAVEESLWKETGHYYSDCTRDFTSCTASSSNLARRLWEESVKFVGIQKWDPFSAPHTSLIKPVSRPRTKESNKSVTVSGHFGEDIEFGLPNYYE
ncbi:hypothetical protein C0J52_11283 [Blattella germanica]|nr:hypothetical protein C0J52_11283 [Blattella germanica]